MNIVPFAFPIPHCMLTQGVYSFAWWVGGVVFKSIFFPKNERNSLEKVLDSCC